jgi:hypothetical protein
MPNLLVTALNAGELSPYMDARTDVEKYRTGCRRLENMIVLPYGGVYRRAGTEYLGEAKLGNKRCRLIGFNFSVTTRFVLELGDQYLRVWGNDGPVLSGGSPLELASPYLEAELREIQYVQVNDIMYLAHANHAPRKLTRVANNNWTLTTVKWEYPPILDQNITPVTIAASAATGSTTLTASDSTFLAGHVGSQWAIQWPRSSGNVNATINGNKASAVLDILGTWTITTVGTWQAKIQLLRIPRKRIDDSGPYDTAATITRANFSSITGVAATDIITATGHTFVNGDPVVFESLTGGAGIRMATQIYYVIDAATNTFQISETVGGAAVNFTTNITAGTVAAANAVVTQTAHGYTNGDEIVVQSSVGEPIGSQSVRTVSVIDANSYRFLSASERTTITNVTGSDATDIFTATNHRFNNRDAVVFESKTGGTGLTALTTIYYIINANGNSFQLSATVGGKDPVNFTSDVTAATIGRVVCGPVYSASDVNISNLKGAEVVREFVSEDTPRNFAGTGTEDERVGLIIRVTNFSEGNVSRVFLESTDFNSGGTVTINTVASGTSAGATVEKWLGSTITATEQWSEAAFSAVRGYPRAVAIHEQRLCFAGTTHQPNTVWCSRVDDFENFQLASSADGALQFTVASSEGNRIAWMFSQKRLMIGTSGDEWTIGGSDSSRPFSSTNIQAQRQSGYGSKTIRAILLNDVLLFLQRRGRKVRELTYNFERDGWVAPDLTVLSEHITEGEIAEMAFQQQPDAILWAVKGDGKLIGMSYERDQNVVAWHRHSTDGSFESVATVYGLSGSDDEVWFAVQRTIGGVSKRYIERFKADNRANFESETKTDWWYLDCAKRYSGASTATVTGLSHLEGKTAGILADGAAQVSATVTSGEVTLAKPATKVLVGLPFTSTVLPMKFDFELRDGPTRGRRKRINRATVSLYRSLGGEVSTDGTEWYWIYPRDFDDPMDASPPPFSGDAEVVVGGDYSFDGDFYLRQTLPYPLTVRALVIKLDAFGD